MLKLDLGCGRSKAEGFVGINIAPGDGDEVDYIRAHKSLKHLFDPQFVMIEFWRGILDLVFLIFLII